MSHSTPSRLLRARSYFSAFAVARREYPGFARHFGLACLLVGGVALLNSATPYLLRLAIDAIGQGSRQGASTSVLAFAGGYGVCWSAAASMEWVRSAAAASMLARCEGAFRQAFHVQGNDCPATPPALIVEGRVTGAAYAAHAGRVS